MEFGFSFLLPKMLRHSICFITFLISCANGCFPSSTLDSQYFNEIEIFTTSPTTTTTDTPSLPQLDNPASRPRYNVPLIESGNPLKKLFHFSEEQLLYKRSNTTAQNTTTTTTRTTRKPPSTQIPFLAPPAPITLPNLFPVVFENSLKKLFKMPKSLVRTEKIPNLMGAPTWKILYSPPVSWTYCNPQCGSGDQALDEETALDNALNDAIFAINSAMQTLKLGSVSDDKVHIKYKPSSILLEEFGNVYDRFNYRYRVVRNSVRYRIKKDTPGVVEDYIEEIEIGLHANYMFTNALWKTIASEMARYLTNEKSRVDQKKWHFQNFLLYHICILALSQFFTFANFKFGVCTIFFE